MNFTYELSTEAQVFFDYEFTKRVERKQQKGFAHYFVSHQVKLGALRLLHIIKNIKEPIEFIDKETINSAIELIDFFDDYAINFQKENTKSDEDKRMEKIQAICLE